MIWNKNLRIKIIIIIVAIEYEVSIPMPNEFKKLNMLFKTPYSFTLSLVRYAK